MSRQLARRLSVLCALGLALALAGAASATAAPHVDGTFPLKSELDTNNKLVAGPDGNIWVTVSDVTNDVARVTPAGEVTEYDLENVKGPSGIAVGPEGRLWVTQNEGIATFTTAEPTKTSTQTIAQVKAVSSIVAGPDGNMWVATEGEVIKISATDPSKSTPIAVAGLKGKDIDVAGSLLVIADGDQTGARIVTLTTAGVEQDYPIDGGSQGVAGAPGGQIGYSQQVPKVSGGPEQVGLITPPNPAQAQTQPDDPFGVAFGSDQAFWIVRAGVSGGLARLTSAGQLTLLGGFPAGTTARQIAAGPGNTLWVASQKVLEPGVIVRVSGLEPPKKDGVPNTTITRGPGKVVRTHHKRAKVSFRFKSTVAGSSFECALTKVRKGKKQTKPRFKACKVPRRFNLAPGSYRFAVRAVAAGGTDATPAKRSFRVVRVREHRRGHR